ncbi:hypothetical protein EAL2_808p06900 (plasmid) [Peptoclostridium acidaminophilum DSM 3953]|uniref:Uncharacterized protein n=1 Tax=Peptoclostridium acidaminophilum DSM 3953 TaxID=1286171 RepID=W8TKD8_PEPAC|nr:hypothetical protein EAL2_808p06900 [Peptoclostridium acidaminophilum DSM 3953]
MLVNAAKEAVYKQFCLLCMLSYSPIHIDIFYRSLLFYLIF